MTPASTFSTSLPSTSVPAGSLPAESLTSWPATKGSLPEASLTSVTFSLLAPKETTLPSPSAGPISPPVPRRPAARQRALVGLRVDPHIQAPGVGPGLVAGRGQPARRRRPVGAPAVGREGVSQAVLGGVEVAGEALRGAERGVRAGRRPARQDADQRRRDPRRAFAAQVDLEDALAFGPAVVVTLQASGLSAAAARKTEARPSALKPWISG